MGRIEETIADVRQVDADLADTLKRLADDFEYGKILSWLRTSEAQA